MSQQVLVEVQKLAHKSGQHALAQTHRKCTQRWIKTQLKIHLEEKLRLCRRVNIYSTTRVVHGL